MTNMNEREKAFESKFAHDAELKFKVEMRCTKLMAAWAAGVMGMNADETAAYVQRLVAADMAEAGHDDVLRQVTADLTTKGIDAAAFSLDKKLAEFLAVAKQQILEG